MFTKQQRTRLNALSLELFGSESRWRKLLKDPKYRIVTEVKDSPESVVYVQFRRGNNDKRPGTVMTYNKAKALGKLPENYEKPAPREVVSREMTCDELMQALKTNLEMEYFANMTDEEGSVVFANTLTNNDLNYKVALLVSESEKETFDGLVSRLPDNLKEKVVAMQVAEIQQDATNYNGVQFATDVIFSVSHPDQATSRALAIMAEAKKTRAKTIKENRVARVLSGFAVRE